MTYRPDIQSDPDRSNEDEAAAWFARMRGPDGSRHRQAFEIWRSASSSHAEAFTRIEVVFAESAVLMQSRRHGRGSGETTHSSPRTRLPSMALAASLLLALLEGLSLLIHPSTLVRRQPTFALINEPLTTKRGQIHRFQLADGTSVTLDTASRVKVVMNSRERRIRLESGKARFAVGRDPRPFMVEAGAGRVAVRTGTFDVSYSADDAVVVTMVSGSATVGPAISHADLVLPIGTLLRGQVYSYQAARFTDVATRSVSKAEDTSDWPSGWVEYRSVPLRRLVADANRYASKPIVIDDAKTAELQASGRFHLADSGTFAARLADVFALQVTVGPDSIQLGRPTNISRSR